MKTFVIDSGNNIAAFDAGQQVSETEGSARFKRSDELGKLAEAWPAARLVEIWNSLLALRRFSGSETSKTALIRVLGGHPKPGRACQKAPRRGTKAHQRAGTGQVGPHGQPQQTGAQRPPKSHCRAGRQQDGKDNGASRTAQGRHPRRNHEGYRMAGPKRPRLHQRYVPSTHEA
jgi:hypothetical protein